jgi:hypothetical protein
VTRVRSEKKDDTDVSVGEVKQHRLEKDKEAFSSCGIAWADGDSRTTEQR